MNELVGRLVAEHGIDRDVAEKAVGIILAFLIKEGPADKVQPLIDRMPGARSRGGSERRRRALAWAGSWAPARP